MGFFFVSKKGEGKWVFIFWEKLMGYGYVLGFCFVFFFASNVEVTVFLKNLIRYKTIIFTNGKKKLWEGC